MYSASSPRSRGISAPIQNGPPVPTAVPPPSYATHCSLRGAAAPKDGIHPLKQNPPSILEPFDDSTGFDDVSLAPPPSALTSRPTHYNPHALASPLEDYTPPSRISHQRSLTGTFLQNCKPLVDRAASTLQQHTSKTSFHSPTKSLASFIPSRNLIESTASQPRFRAGAKVWNDWFSGSSAPVSLGVHTKEESDTEYSGSEDEEEEEEEHKDKMMAGLFGRAPVFTRSTTTTTTASKETVQPPRKDNTTAAGKFSWLPFPQKANPSAQPPSNPIYHNPSDELLTLDLNTALFPHGPVDPLAPSSFHDLLTAAEQLLTRYQNSYRALSTALADCRAEQSAQDDELDEADTRVRHLKMQLETMAARANEQDVQMQKLKEELAAERAARKAEMEARKRSLALVRGPNCVHTHGNRKRVSNSDVSVDSGFESECESEAASSVFSRTNGATSPTDTVPSSTSSEVGGDAHLYPAPLSPTKRRPQGILRTSTYEKVLSRNTVEFDGGWGCANCEGSGQSEVWGRLHREREENLGLRRRVEELESCVLGALDVVDGPLGI